MIWRYLWRQIHQRGYVLVHADRYEPVWRLQEQLRNKQSYINERLSEDWRLNDRITELEAEIEGHKRVNEALAARVVEAERKPDGKE